MPSPTQRSRAPAAFFVVSASIVAACAGNPTEGEGLGPGVTVSGAEPDPDSSSDDGSPPGDASSTEDLTPTDDAATTSDADATGGSDATTEAIGSTSDASTEESGGAPTTDPVNLGMASTYAVLSQTGIASVPPTVITGDIGVSPAAATYITGFSLSADATNVFSTSAQVTGNVYAADYAVPTPANMTTAILDVGIAIVDAAGRIPDVVELGNGNIGGMRLDPGVYSWTTGVSIPTDVTLDGEATDVWIFQIAGELTLSDDTIVLLTGGAVPENIFWEIAGLVDIGADAHLEGVVLAQTAIRLRTGASLDGRLLTQTAVTLDGTTSIQSPQ